MEPFCGSASLFFSLQKRKAYLYDLNPHVVHALQWVKSNPTDVHSAYAAFVPDRESYFLTRAAYNKGGFEGAAKAAAFVYLNRHCFNGLWRTNLRGEFNVPYGGASSSPLPEEVFLAFSEHLADTALAPLDFRDSLRIHATHPEQVTVYADPPYSTSTRRTFVEYGPKPFTRECLVELASALKQLAAGGARVIVSYCDDPLARELFADWEHEQVSVTRNVGGFGSRRRTAVEMLWYSFRPQHA